MELSPFQKPAGHEPSKVHPSDAEADADDTLINWSAQTKGSQDEGPAWRCKEVTMPDDVNTPADQKAAEAEVEKFRRQLGPFVVAAEKTRMAMIFTDASKADSPIVFANDSFLKLTHFTREEILGTSFKSLMARGTETAAMAEIEAAFTGKADEDLEVCYQRSDGTSFWASVFISPVDDEAGNVVQHFISLIDCTKLHEKQEHAEMMVNELNHRVKNTLTTVQSITRQALRASDDPKVVGQLIESRLFALSRSHDLLTRENWQGAQLRAIINAALEPFDVTKGRSKRCKIEGKDIRLKPKAALTLGIAFHELATNAVKFGSLSNDVGTVLITWDTETRPAGERLVLTWREKDGPVVVPPTHRGFGSQVIERGLAHELGGEVRLDYLPEGLTCTMDLPLSQEVIDA